MSQSSLINSFINFAFISRSSICCAFRLLTIKRIRNFLSVGCANRTQLLA